MSVPSSNLRKIIKNCIRLETCDRVTFASIMTEATRLDYTIIMKLIQFISLHY